MRLRTTEKAFALGLVVTMSAYLVTTIWAAVHS
jgi:hypothetical protein